MLGALADAREGLAAARCSRASLGIGKTRLADEVAAHARDQGIHTTRCWEDGGGLLPTGRGCSWSVRACGASTRPSSIGVWALAPPELAELLPELRELLGWIPRSVIRDPEALRFCLFEAVGLPSERSPRPTGRSSSSSTISMQLTSPSLLLLPYLAGAIGDSRILALGAYRDTEPGPDDPFFQRVLGDLLRERRVTRIPLWRIEAGRRRGVRAAQH